jgi:SAM-dependent methyltransferase
MASVTGLRCDTATTSAAYAHGADAYDALWSPVIRPPAVKVVRRLELRHTTRIVDVGAGTGALTPELRAAAPKASILSVDPSREMLRYARAHRGAVPVVADALALPLRTCSTDAVLLAYVLFMLTDPVAGLREAARVVRVGGRIGTVTWASEEPARAALVWEETLAELDIPTLPAHGNHGGLDSEDAVAHALTDAGLAPIDVWRETVERRFEPSELWRLRTEHGVNRLRLAMLEPDRRRRVLGIVRDRMAALPRSAYRFRGSVVCSVGYTTARAYEPH